MGYCSYCGVPLQGPGNFCPSCGAPTKAILSSTATASAVESSACSRQQPYPQPPPYSRQPAAGDVHYAAARGFSQIFGIHPAIAFLTLTVDVMLFGGETASLGTSLPLSVTVAALLGFIAYKAQMKWYGDDKESASIKALILALLTAIPTALPAFLYVPAGIVGFFRRKTD